MQIFSAGRTGRDGMGPIKGSTRGPCGPKKVQELQAHFAISCNQPIVQSLNPIVQSLNLVSLIEMIKKIIEGISVNIFNSLN